MAAHGKAVAVSMQPQLKYQGVVFLVCASAKAMPVSSPTAAPAPPLPGGESVEDGHRPPLHRGRS